MMVALAAVLASGCADPAPQAAEEPDWLAQMGLEEVATPFAADGDTACLPGEDGDDTLCEPPRSTRLLLGPYDAPIIGVEVDLTWQAGQAGARELVMTVLCHENGFTATPPPCDGVDAVQVRGPSPLHADLAGLATEPTALIEVRVEVPDGAAGQALPTRQAFHWDGVLRTAREPRDG